MRALIEGYTTFKNLYTNLLDLEYDDLTEEFYINLTELYTIIPRWFTLSH